MDKANLKPAHLRRIKSLALLNDEQLTAFLEYVKVMTCSLSGTLFQEGQPGDSMFLILEGQMRVYTKQKNGEVVFLRLLNAGDAFGEIALLNHAVRSASVEAVQSSVLLTISSLALERIIAEQPALAAQFLYHLARSLGRQLGDLTTKLRAQREYAEIVSFLQ
jgi:CRP/FNR family transcriptional regulator, cyclic AMP receptor protein